MERKRRVVQHDLGRSDLIRNQFTERTRRVDAPGLASAALIYGVRSGTPSSDSSPYQSNVRPFYQQDNVNQLDLLLEEGRHLIASNITFMRASGSDIAKSMHEVGTVISSIQSAKTAVRGRNALSDAESRSSMTCRIPDKCKALTIRNALRSREGVRCLKVCRRSNSRSRASSRPGRRRLLRSVKNHRLLAVIHQVERRA